MYFDDTVLSIYNSIKEEKQLIFAIDGGAVKYKESLGFVLTDTTGERMLSCYG